MFEAEAEISSWNILDTRDEGIDTLSNVWVSDQGFYVSL